LIAVIPVEQAYPLVIVFVGYVVFGLTGFGSALIIVPLLAFQLPLQEVVPLVLLLDLVASAQLGHLNFSAIRFSELWRLIPAMILGAGLGLYVAQWGSHPLLLVALGVYIVSVGVTSWRRTSGTELAQIGQKWSALFGLLSGLVEVVFATSGPLIVAYLTRRLPDVNVLRSTISSGIFVVVAIALGGMAATGRLNDASLWQRFPWLLSATVIGCYLGHRSSSRIKVERLKRGIYFVLAASGLAMIAHAVIELTASVK
jgi:uncharacterized protein